LIELCVGSEFTAFCDICKTVNRNSKCPVDLSCKEELIEYDGIVGLCSKGHIVTLKAYNKKIAFMPQTLNEMTYLQSMNLGDNRLISLPVLKNLTALKTVYIHNNKIKKFTGVFVNSLKMEFISASNNALQELPPELANMTLKNLNVANNNISSIPIEYKNMKNLTNLDLSGNILDCSKVRSTFTGIIAEQCIQTQQKTEKDVAALPLTYTGDPTRQGLDGYEIAAIVLACVFVCLLIPSVILYTMYRRNGLSTLA